MKSLLKSAPPSAIFGMVVLAIVAFTGVFAPIVAPYGETQVVGDAYLPWSAAHPLGTDPWPGPDDSPGIDALLCTVCQLTAAWSIQQQPQILVHALILVETMIMQDPGVLTAATARPLSPTRRDDGVRIGSNSKKRPPTSSEDGDDARRWRKVQ